MPNASPVTDALIGLIVLAIGTIVFIRRAVNPAMKTMPEGFVRFYVAARWLLWGRERGKLYQISTLRNMARLFGLPLPVEGFTAEQPTTAMVLAPVGWLSPQTARKAWTLGNVALYLCGVNLLLDALAIQEFLPRCLLWALALVWSPTHEALKRGEPAALVFSLQAIALRELTRGQLWLAGGWLGVSLLIKPYSWPLLPVLGLRGQMKTLLGAGAALLGLAITMLPWTGLGTWGQFLGHEAPAALASGFSPAPQWQGLGSAIGNAFTHDAALSPVPWTNAPALAVGLQAMMTAFVLILGLGIAGRRQPQLSDPMAFGTAILTGLIVSPRAAEHHFTLALLPALSIVARYLGGAGGMWIPWVLIASISLLAAPFGTIPEGQHPRGAAKLVQYARLLGAIGLFVMCVLAPMFRPEVWG